jgi:hypothetical protein
MVDEFCYLRIQRDRLPADQVDSFYAQGLILDLDSELLRHLFLLQEAKDRGFFVDNNLSQLTDGRQQLPLLTWSFLDFLSTRALESQTLVELGSGNSTLWFAQRFKSVRSYETNAGWIEQLQKRTPNNVTLSFIEISDLESAQIDLQSTDWLLIDFAGGRTKFIASMLARGIQPTQIVLDNADWYRNGAKLLIDEGYTEVPFFGFKSGQTWISCTSLFIKGSLEGMREGTFAAPKNARRLKNSWDQL